MSAPVDRHSRRAALTLTLCLPSDVMLYLLMPMYPEAFGLGLPEVGILLAANRLVRIFGYRHVMNFYGRHGDRRTMLVAASGAAVCALGNSLVQGFFWLLVLRLIWGLCFAAFNLSTQVLATSQAEGAAQRSGRSRGLIAVGPMLALLIGGPLAMWLGPRAVIGLTALGCLAGIWAARQLPAKGHVLDSGKRRFRLPDSVALWSFIEGVALDGLFILGLSLQAKALMGSNAVLVAGVLMALRYGSELLLAPLGGRLAARLGSTAMLLVLSSATALGLIAFGWHWVVAGGAAVLVLRALQLPLVTTLVAERNPGTQRVSALASNAIWRDIGAGIGPLLAGLVLPIAPAGWVFSAAGLAIVGAAIHCWRQGNPSRVVPR